MKGWRRPTALLALLVTFGVGAACGGGSEEARGDKRDSGAAFTDPSTRGALGPAFSTTRPDGDVPTRSQDDEDEGDDDGQPAASNTVVVGPAFGDPRVIDFGESTVGVASEPQALAVRNGNPEPLSVSTVAVVGDHAGDFVVLPETTCSPDLELARDATCEIVLVFQPTEPGTRNAVLAISVDGGLGRQLRLTGTALT